MSNSGEFIIVKLLDLDGKNAIDGRCVNGKIKIDDFFNKISLFETIFSDEPYEVKRMDLKKEYLFSAKVTGLEIYSQHIEVVDSGLTARIYLEIKENDRKLLNDLINETEGKPLESVLITVARNDMRSY